MNRYPVPPVRNGNVYGDVVDVRVVVVGFDVIEYWDAPVTVVHVRSIDVDVPFDGVIVGTAAGRVHLAFDVVDVTLRPDALFDRIVNVYCVPAVRPGNVNEVPVIPL